VVLLEVMDAFLVTRDARIDDHPTPLSRCVCRRPRARLMEGTSDGAVRHTHHAAGTTEVHVAASHETQGGTGSDHGDESHVADADPTNPDLVM
jgi:hypothetical protein